MDDVLVPKGCELYVVAIDQSGQTWSDWGPRWTKLIGDKHVVRLASVQELRQRFNHIVNQIFSIPQVPPDLLTEGKKSFAVKPYLDRVEFHVFPSTREMKLRIMRPDGSPVRPDSDADVRRRQFKDYEIISVFDPPAGDWEYEVTAGKGKVEVYRNEVPLTMKLVLPGSVHPQGKALEIIAQFARHSGKPVTSETEFPLGLSAQVLGPTGKPVNVEFGDPVEGLYYGNRPVATKMPGSYTITLRVQAGSALDSQTVYQVRVAPVPYLELDAPKVTGLPFMQRYLSVTGQLMLTGKPAPPADLFTNNPNLLYLAQVPNMPNGEKSPTLWMASSGSRFSARFRLPMRKRLGIAQPWPGNYLVATECAGKPIQQSATRYVDKDMRLITVRASWLYAAASVSVGLLGIYLLLVVTSWVWLATRLMTARKMRIGATILHAPTGTQLGTPGLSGKTWVSIRTKPWRDQSQSLGKRVPSVGGRLLVFWGVDKAATTVGFARVVAGIAIPGSVRQGSSRTVGALRIQL